MFVVIVVVVAVAAAVAVVENEQCKMSKFLLLFTNSIPSYLKNKHLPRRVDYMEKSGFTYLIHAGM